MVRADVLTVKRFAFITAFYKFFEITIFASNRCRDSTTPATRTLRWREVARRRLTQKICQARRKSVPSRSTSTWLTLRKTVNTTLHLPTLRIFLISFIKYSGLSTVNNDFPWNCGGMFPILYQIFFNVTFIENSNWRCNHCFILQLSNGFFQIKMFYIWELELLITNTHRAHKVGCRSKIEKLELFKSCLFFLQYQNGLIYSCWQTLSC